MFFFFSFCVLGILRGCVRKESAFFVFTDRCQWEGASVPVLLLHPKRKEGWWESVGKVLLFVLFFFIVDDGHG